MSHDQGPSLFGCALFGKVDIAPHLLTSTCQYPPYVKTAFLHILKLPLIPVESYFVISEGQRGLKIILPKLVIESVLMAWVTLLLYVLGWAGLFPIFALLYNASRGEKAAPPTEWTSPTFVFLGLAVSLLALAVFWLFRWVLRIRSADKIAGAIEELA